MRCRCCNSANANLDTKAKEYYCTKCKSLAKANLRNLKRGKFTIADLFRILGDNVEDDTTYQIPECGRKVESK